MEKRAASGGREAARTTLLLLLLECLAAVHAHFGSCENHTPYCDSYARRGDCVNRRQYMLQNCPESCEGFCVDPDCYDRSNTCSTSALKGLCQTQRSFMVRQCPHSCDACRIGLQTAVANTDFKTIINPDFVCGRPILRKKRQVYFPDELADLDTRAGSRQPPRTQSVQRNPDSAVSLTIPDSSRDLYVNDTFCGASPITDQFLLTAAHCVYDERRPLTTVRLGELDFASQDEANSRPADYEVAKIYVHPDYDSNSRVRYNDIAIIQTKQRMRFSDLVYPFCISENPPFPGTIVTAAGFGFSSGNSRPTHLQEAKMEVLENSRCEEIFRQSNNMDHLRVYYPELLQGKNILCASFPRTSSCNGDSGGPLYEQRNGLRYLVGIVSTGSSCRGSGVPSLPGVYVNVADHVQFINSVVYSPALL